MLKVMVVDDEQSVLTGLRYLLDWGSYGYELCGAFQDPALALASAGALSPNLIITDIEMPGISGLDLIASLQETVPDSVCVILSAYNDFKYAQEAVRLGVFRYLLKPLAPEELAAALLEVKSRFFEDTPGVSELTAVRDFVIREIVVNGADIFRAVMLPYYKKLNSKTGLCLMAVYFPPESGPPGGGEETAAALRAQYAPYSLFRVGDVCMLLLDGVSGPGAASAPEKSCVCRVSEPFSGLSGAHGAYVRLMADLENELFWGSETAPGIPLTEDAAVLAEPVKNCLLQALCDPEGAVVREAFDRLLARIQAHAYKMDRSDAARVYADIVESAENFYQSVCEHKRGRRMDAERVSALPTLRETHACALEAVSRILADARAEIGQSSPELIQKARRCIQEHYCEPDFHLTGLADALFINYSYLSHLFRMETGKTLYSYLLDLRMQQARRLLAMPELSITEIGSRVGYASTKAFYNTFKKYHSESPKSYRQMLRKKGSRGNSVD